MASGQQCPNDAGQHLPSRVPDSKGDRDRYVGGRVCIGNSGPKLTFSLFGKGDKPGCRVYADFVSPGRFRVTEGADTYTGSYTFQNTGSNTGTLTFNYDDGDRCTTHLTFASAMAGTATFTCNDGSSGAYDWRLIDIPG